MTTNTNTEKDNTMNTYQLLNRHGLILGTVNADTRSAAVQIAHTIWNTDKITAVLA